MKKITVVFDVDGVLLNLLQTISGFIEKKYKIMPLIPFSSSQYSIRKRFDKDWIDSIGLENIKKEFEKEGYWSLLDPMPEIDKIYELSNNPLFDISFLTNIPSHLAEQRLRNLSALFGKNINQEKLICLPMGEPKQPYIAKLNPDYFIEDNLHILRDCNAKHQSIWINHNENVYDESCLKDLSVIEVKTLNDGLAHIQKQLYNKDAETLVGKVTNVLTDELLPLKYKDVERSSNVEGHSYASTEALFYLLGGKSSGLEPQVATFEKNGENVTHWWLKDEQGKILDPTADQFYTTGQNPPYEVGKNEGFLTKAPSKRSLSIINRIMGNELVPRSEKNTKKIKF